MKKITTKMSISSSSFQSEKKPRSLSRAVKARRAPNLTPYEDDEQMALATYLNMRFGDEWEHVPGQRWAKVQYIVKLKRMGARKGSFDIRIYRPPVIDRIKYCGTAIELKRQKGGRIDPEQLAFEQMLIRCGWKTFFASGAQDAINKIEAIYNKE